MNKHAVSIAALLLVATLSGCSGAGSSANSASPTATTISPTPTATKTVTKTATATPSTLATTGSYAADLAALGVVPDNVKSYADYMEKQICDQTGTGLGVAVRSIGGGTAKTGGGVDVVRLTVAYFCPNKSQEVESYLDYFKQ
jgi:ABC-type Fe3+-hydroxamate transport system substrate-binding protein